MKHLRTRGSHFVPAPNKERKALLLMTSIPRCFCWAIYLHSMHSSLRDVCFSVPKLSRNRPLRLISFCRDNIDPELSH